MSVPWNWLDVWLVAVAGRAVDRSADRLGRFWGRYVLATGVQRRVHGRPWSGSDSGTGAAIGCGRHRYCWPVVVPDWLAGQPVRAGPITGDAGRRGRLSCAELGGGQLPSMKGSGTGIGADIRTGVLRPFPT